MHLAVAVARVHQGVALQVVVGLVVGRYQAHNLAFLHGVGRHKVDHAGHAIGAVEQGTRAFDNLGAVDGVLVYLDAVLVAPLLAFLLGAVVQGDDAVGAQPADDRLADGRAGGVEAE